MLLYRFRPYAYRVLGGLRWVPGSRIRSGSESNRASRHLLFQTRTANTLLRRHLIFGDASYNNPCQLIMPSSSEVKDITLQVISTALGCARNKDQRSCHFPDELKEEGRFAWGALGDAIEAAPFLPITINVPDMIYGMYEMFHWVIDYFFGGETGDASTPRIWEFLQEVENALPDI